MGVARFEDLRVWQAAMALSNRASSLTNRPEFARDLELSRQLNAASLSVANNISEGFLRNRDREFLQFLRIAAGSNGEVRSCLHAAFGRGYIDKMEAGALIEETNAIGRMIRRLQQTLGRKD
jgi:four helix bundle protein